MNYFTVNTIWNYDRIGIKSPQLSNTLRSAHLEVAAPNQTKDKEAHWSPEHLFTAAISSCLVSTFLSIATRSRLDFVSVECSAKGKMEMVEGQLRFTEIELEPVIVLPSDDYRNKARKVMQRTQDACLLTHSVNARLSIKPVFSVQSA